MVEPVLRIRDERGRRKPVKKKLTQAKVRDVKPPASGRLTIYDTATPGLALQVTATGAKSYYIIRRLNGRSRRIWIADGGMALEDVKKLAAKRWAEALDGTDPVAERKRKRKRAATLGELWKLYCTERERSATTIVGETSMWKHVGAMQGRALDAIKPEDVIALHRRIGSERGKISANRTIQLIRRVYRFAKRSHIYRGENPAEGLELYPEHSRERYVTPDELPALIAAIEAEPDPWPDYFKLALLTGARRSALAAMRWADVDLNAGTWAIPASDSKNKSGVTVALVPDAVERLQQRRADAAEGDTYVFPGRQPGRHVTNPWPAWKRIRKAAGLGDVTIHDLRRTCGSYLAAAGVSLPLIGKALGHKSPGSTAIYSRLDVSDVRKELAHVADVMKATNATAATQCRRGKVKGRLLAARDRAMADPSNDSAIAWWRRWHQAAEKQGIA